MKDRFLDDPAVYQVLRNDSLQQRRSHTRIPNPIWINDDDRTTTTDPETRCFTALHAIRTEEQAVSLKQRRQHLIELPSAAIRRTEPADTHEDVAGVSVHSWQNVGRHDGG